MSYSKDYTKTYKFRTTPAQADALESYAESNNYSISEAIRKLLFTKTSHT